MFRIRTLARLTAATSVSLTLAAALVAAPVHADPVVDLSWTVKTTTTLKKLDKTVKLPAGTLTAQIDMATGKVEGDLTLSEATKRISVPGLPLADVTVALTQAAPVTGKVNLTAGRARAKASFNVRIVAIRPVHAPAVNLVSGKCTTKKPVKARLNGPINSGGVSTFESRYTMSKFTKCGSTAESVINSLLAGGPKNTMTIKLS